MPGTLTPAPTNPFIFARPLTAGEAIDRTAEAGDLLARLNASQNVVLHAPRRLGKTTLLAQLREQAQAQGAPCVRVDLTDVLSPPT